MKRQTIYDKIGDFLALTCYVCRTNKKGTFRNLTFFVENLVFRVNFLLYLFFSLYKLILIDIIYFIFLLLSMESFSFSYKNRA